MRPSDPIIPVVMLLIACARAAPPGHVPPGCPGEAISESGLSDTTIYDAESVDAGPVVLGPFPVIREDAETDRVEVQFVLGADGRAEPNSLRAVHYTRFEFTEPAFEALRQMRFCPAVRHGVRVRARGQMALSVQRF